MSDSSVFSSPGTSEGQSTSTHGDSTPVGSEAPESNAPESNTDPTSVPDAPDPTGATPEQMAAKKAANALGDMDAANQAAALPEGADVPSAANVQAYPWLFSQEVIDSFQVDDTMNDDQRDEHNQAVADHWASMGAPTVDDDSSATGDESFYSSSR